MLMTPGNRPERLYKAVSSLADSVVFDLEDSIPPDQKNQARQIVAQTLVNLSADQKEVCVRINGLDTPYGDEDIKQIPWRLIDSVMLPKIESPQQLNEIEKRLDLACGLTGRKGPLELIVMLETPRGVLNALSIADSSKHATALFFGSGDYTSAMSAQICESVLQYPRSVVCAAAAASGKQAIDAAYFLQVKDAEATCSDAQIARRFGFAGKVVFHPNQIDVVNDVFTPTLLEIEHANKIVNAYEKAKASGIGTLVVDGHFVAVDLVPPAKRLLMKSKTIGII
jgi:citrate lyase subunit beta/citryl-CoA lyase